MHDHSWFNEVVDAGEMTPEQAAQAPDRNAITRCLGPLGQDDPGQMPEVDVVACQVEAGQMLLLCSDGLWKYASDPAQLAPLVCSEPTGGSTRHQPPPGQLRQRAGWRRQHHRGPLETAMTQTPEPPLFTIESFYTPTLPQDGDRLTVITELDVTQAAPAIWPTSSAYSSSSSTSPARWKATRSSTSKTPF